MKRIISILLLLLLLAGLAGCMLYEPQPEDGGQSIDIQIVTQGETGADHTQAQTREPEAPPQTEAPVPVTEARLTVTEEGVYDSKEEVALYIHLFGHLPSNYITKKEAEDLGWRGGSLEPYAPGKCIGGSYFGNYEELLPKKAGRSWTECDIDTLGADKRGAKRIIFSNDGLIYYTEDHYESFELLYGKEG